MRNIIFIIGMLVGCGQNTTVSKEAQQTSNEEDIPQCWTKCGKNLNKVVVCHQPPGNQANRHTICVSQYAWRALYTIGDYCGKCEEHPVGCDVCGNEECEESENCSNCSEDCGGCEPWCGDGQCNGEETCLTCEEDCGSHPPVCGDETCNGNENCSNCPGDCGQCEPFCGDDMCNGGEDCETCSLDCGLCVTCGDGLCFLENCVSCPEDCGFCSLCDDGVCEDNENCSNCPGDCGECDPMPTPDASPVEPELGVRGGGCSVQPGVGTSPLSFLALILVIGGFMFVRYRQFLLGIAIFLIFTSSVNAQELTLERFSPTTHGPLNVDSPLTLQPGSWGLQMFFNYSNDPLEVYNLETGEHVSTLVNDRYHTDFGGYYSFGRLQLGVNLPVLGQSSPGDSLEAFSLGDLRVTAKTHFTGVRFLNLGAGLTVTAPTHTSDDYFGENYGLYPYMSASKAFGDVEITGNLGYGLRPDETLLNLTTGNEVYFRGAVSYNLNNGETCLNTGFSTATSASGDILDKQNRDYSEVLLGIDQKMGPFTGTLGAGRGLNEGFGSPDFRIFAGLKFNVEKAYEPVRREEEPAPTPLPEPEPPVGPTPTPTPEPEPIVPPPVVVGNVYFDFDKSVVKGEYHHMLDTVVEVALSGQGSVTILVDGHTDNYGSNKYNDRLGLQRANAVRDYLLSRGVPDNMVRVVSKGELSPWKDNNTDEGRGKNRRVEIYLQGTTANVSYERE